MVVSIPSTMMAWRKHKGNPEPVWDEVQVPQCAPGGFLIKMLASGVCRSDHSLLTNENQRPWFQHQYILGHEGCGTIIQIGDKVKDTSFKLGDRVAAISVPGCGRDDCPECSKSLPQLCEKAHHSGIGQDGFFAPYAALDARAAVLVPEGISSSLAAVATDAVKTSYHAITQRAEVKPHETIFLFGLGGLGFNALQIVLHIGARIIVSDVRQELLDEAVRIGVPSQDVVPLNSSIRNFVREKGLLIDTTLDFVGKHQTFQDAQNILRRGGKMLCVGTLDLENTVDMKIGVRKRLTILFTYGGRRDDLEEVLDLIASGVIKPQVENAPLRDFPRLLKELCDGRIKGRVALLHD